MYIYIYIYICTYIYLYIALCGVAPIRVRDPAIVACPARTRESVFVLARRRHFYSSNKRRTRRSHGAPHAANADKKEKTTNTTIRTQRREIARSLIPRDAPAQPQVLSLGTSEIDFFSLIFIGDLYKIENNYGCLSLFLILQRKTYVFP